MHKAYKGLDNTGLSHRRIENRVEGDIAHRQLQSILYIGTSWSACRHELMLIEVEHNGWRLAGGGDSAPKVSYPG